MSLFDRNSSADGVSARSSESSCSDEDSSPLELPPLPAQKQTLATCGRGRNTLTEDDVRIAAAERRAQLAMRLNYRGPAQRSVAVLPCTHASSVSSSSAGTAGHDAGVHTDNSLFGNSIAEALQIRKAEQEKLLLRRIKKERERDAGDAALVEKDLEVGVFVTAAYKGILRKHRHNGAEEASKEAPDSENDRREKKQGDGVAEDADPLEAYLCKLEKEDEERTSARAAEEKASSGVVEKDGNEGGDFYDRMMLASLKCEHMKHQSADDMQDSEGSERPFPSTETAKPSIGELQRLLLQQEESLGAAIPSPLSAHNAEQSNTRENSQPKEQRPQRSTVQEKLREEHEHFLYAARESRKRRRADASFIAASTARAEARIAKCLGVTA